MEKTAKSLIIAVTVLLIWLWSASISLAASMYFFPANRSYPVGQTFTVSVLVESVHDEVNAVSGVVTYPTDKIELLSSSKSGSIIDLWPEEPSISNENGTFHYEGVILNPGFRGSAGKIITLTFRPRSPALVDLRFSSGSILANDGKGTNILDSLGTGSFTIQNSPVSSKAPSTKPLTTFQPTTSADESATSSPTIIVLTPAHPAVIVATTTRFQLFMKEVTSLLSLIVPLVALIVLLLLLLYYAWQKYKSLKKRMSREALEAEIVLGRSFTALKDSVKTHISKLESLKMERSLSPEEDRFLEQLKSDLHSIEANVKKEIKDIERL